MQSRVFTYFVLLLFLSSSAIANNLVISNVNSAGVFSDVAFVQGAGNSNVAITYSWLDQDLMEQNADIFYYRLRQVDNDGGESITETVSLSKSDAGNTNNDEISVVRLFPNPSIDGIGVKMLLSSSIDGTVAVQLFDASAKKVYNIQNSVSIGLNMYALPDVYLQPGSYNIVVSIQGESVTLPLVITK
jgi:hypothetical protein